MGKTSEIVERPEQGVRRIMNTYMKAGALCVSKEARVAVIIHYASWCVGGFVSYLIEEEEGS